MHFRDNKKDRKEFNKLYSKSYEYYENQNMSLKEIELEIARLESKVQNYSNPGIPIVASIMILIITLYANIFSTNILGFWFNAIMIIVIIIFYFFTCFTDRISINTTKYSACIMALIDLKNKSSYRNYSYRKFIK